MPDSDAFRDEMLAVSKTSPRTFPWRTSTDPYAVLIGEVLLQRTRGEHVVPVYNEMFRRWPTAGSLARARLATIERVIRPLGLIGRAATLKALARRIEDIGFVPADPSDLIRLPGIGRYGAHAVPIFARGKALPLVDWVIARVLRRYFGLEAGRRPNNDEELWRLAGELVPQERPAEFWLGVLDFAALTCRPRPLCEQCPLADTCAFVAG